MDITAQGSDSQFNLWSVDNQVFTFAVMAWDYKQENQTGDDSYSDTLQLSCFVSREQYKYITQQSCLNLTSETQNHDVNITLISDTPIQLEIALKPDLVAQLNEQITTPESAIAHLQELSRKQTEENQDDIHPLLQEQNWYCTRIKQHQPTGEICYHTLWHYLLPTLQDPTSESIANSITQFIQDQTTDSLKQITAATDPLFQDIAQTFQALFTNALSNIESDDPEFGEHSDDSGSTPLIDAVTEFLDIEEWPYAQIPDIPANTIALRLAFRGEQGQWPCYCKINQEQQTVCFYSISPMTADPEHYGAIAHFLTRANYGMILGNFELDFRDGEIRYKTSIDVEGDRLTPALVQNLVYTNVMMMDQYLPGILAVLEQGASPEDAIRRVEREAVSEEM